MTAIQSFGLFLELPSKLRELIWKAALPSSRLVQVEAQPLELEDDFYEREEMMYEEDLYGKDEEEEDTRSLPEKDMRLLVHKMGQGLDGSLRRQSQLHKYGFISSRPTPNIAHVSFHDPATYQGFGQYEPNPIRASRDVRLLQHIWDYTMVEGRRQSQTQLHSYGFKISHLLPAIRHVSRGDLYDSEQAIRFYSYPSFPIILHVCRESRQHAIRSGYALAFSIRWAPAQTWFNFKTDFLRSSVHKYMEYPAEYHAQDRQRVTRLALDAGFFESLGDVYIQLRLFENLEELLIVMADTGPSNEDDWLFIDCTVAEALEHRSYWNPTNIGFHEIRDYIKAHPTGPPFYDHLVKNLERYVTRQFESLTQQGKPGFKIPRFRYVNVTDEQGERDLDALCAQYWGEREEFPPKEEWERFRREDLDARLVARHPSPFALQYADDLEVDNEIFGDRLIGSGYYY